MLEAKSLPENECIGGWWQMQPSAPRHPRLEQDLCCDCAVVGAGWTGLAAAHRLAVNAPDARIAILDAGRVGYGSAGRNSGFLYDLPFVFSPDAYRGREEDGKQEIRLYRSVIDELREVLDTPALGSDWAEIGQYHGAVGPAGERELATIEAGLRNLGEPFRKLAGKELSAALGTDHYRAAIHTPGTVQVNPLALVRAYADALPKNVELFERSAVAGIETGTRPQVLTNRGSVTASAVLLTTNAYLRAFRGLKPSIVPVMTFSSMTRPIAEDGPGASAGEEQWGLVPSAMFGSSIRRLANGRFLVRNTYAPTRDFTASPRRRALAKQRQVQSLRRRFPELGAIELEWSWAGIVSFFRGANGFFETVAPGVHAAVTSGMPTCLLYGQQLAEHVAGSAGGALTFVRRRSKPGSLPPEPILSLTTKAIAAARQRRERGEI